MVRQPEWLNLPNKITLSRLLIAIVLFVILSLHLAGCACLDRIGLGNEQVLLNVTLVIFVLCVATDWLDGFLARRWGMVTKFGRVADPFVDKVVVCGIFIYLIRIAPAFIPVWFAVVLIAREFLVTSLRSFLESEGTEFGARWGGKIKMIVQSVAIPCVLFYQANFQGQEGASAWERFCFYTAHSLVILTLLATLLSAWDYLSLAIALRRKRDS